MRLEGKLAIVTGGSEGIGEAVASLMAKEDARVVICARRGELLEKAAQKMREKTGGTVLAIPGDVTKEEDWQRIVETTVSKFGKLDILVNNAGIVRRFPLEETPLEAWNQMLTINATGIFLGTRAVIPEMKKHGGGSIVNMSSIGGIVGLANNSAYQATKGAIRIFTKSTAIEYARDGIRANSVHPGVIASKMQPDFLKDPASLRKIVPYIPLDCMGTPEDVAYGVLYLASDESSYVTGAELVIDGGMTAH